LTHVILCPDAHSKLIAGYQKTSVKRSFLM
jgi:hypothetical protein